MTTNDRAVIAAGNAYDHAARMMTEVVAENERLRAALAAVEALATFIDDDVIASRIRAAIAQAGAEDE